MKEPPKSPTTSLNYLPGRSPEEMQGKTKDEAKSLAQCFKSKADYFWWARQSYWSINEAAALMIGKNPNLVNDNSIKKAHDLNKNLVLNLDAIFNNLAQKAAEISFSYNGVQMMDSVLRLAYKAQSQCRTTLETLDQIKNPVSRGFFDGGLLF